VRATVLWLACGTVVVACSAGTVQPAAQQDRSSLARGPYHATAPVGDAQPDAVSAEVGMPGPVPILAMEPERWLRASQSTSTHVDLPGLTCIRDVGGCPFKPTALPVCPTAQPVAEPSTFSELDALAGTLTVLRGKIVMPLRQARDCGPHCCAKGHPELGLRVQLASTPQGGSRIGLRDDRFPEAFICVADEFSWCCGVPVDITVLAHGLLEKRVPSEPGYDSQLSAYRMVNPILCTERSLLP